MNIIKWFFPLLVLGIYFSVDANAVSRVDPCVLSFNGQSIPGGVGWPVVALPGSSAVASFSGGCFTFDWVWKLEDAFTGEIIQTGEGPNFSWTYPGAGGRYIASYSPAEGGAGGSILSDSASKPVTVFQPPAACTLGTALSLDASQSIYDPVNFWESEQFLWAVRDPNGNLVSNQFSGPVVSFVPTVPGSYTASVQVETAGTFFGDTISRTINCQGTNIVYDVSSIEVAQSPFLSPDIKYLIAGKPAMARIQVKLNSTSSTPTDSTNVGVLGIFSDDLGNNYSLVGCFPANQITSKTTPVFINLFEQGGKTGLPLFGGDVHFSVTINPTNSSSNSNVTGIRSGGGMLGCNATSTANFSSAASSVVQSPFPFRGIPSSMLEIDYVKINPPCSEGPCKFNLLSQFDNYIKSETDLLAATYPFAPQNVSYLAKPEWSIIGDAASTTFLPQDLDKEARACVGSRGTIDGCHWEFLARSLLHRVRAAVISKETSQSNERRIVGVASNSGTKSNPQNGYFHYISSLTNNSHPWEAGYSRPDAEPDVSVAEEGDPLLVAHEIVHTFRVLYPNLTNSKHQVDRPAVTSSGYWASKLNEGVLSNLRSFMISNAAKFSLSDLWMDAPTYKFLMNKIYGTSRSSPRFRQLDGNQVYIDGFVGLSGEFVPDDTFFGPQIGVAVGEASQFMQFASIDPTGTILSQASIPLDFSALDEDKEEDATDVNSPLASISTGLPFPVGALKIVATQQSGFFGRLGRSVEFFPLIESLRTTLNNVPASAFLGSAADQHGALAAVLSDAEKALSVGDMTAAHGLINETFSALAANSISRVPQKTSSLETDLTDVLIVSEVSSSALQAVSSGFPATSNEFINVISSASPLAPGSNANFRVQQKFELADNKNEFALRISFGENNWEASGKSPWRVSTPVLEPGVHEISFQLVTRDRISASRILAAIESLKRQVASLENQIENEVDPVIHERLVARLTATQNEIRNMLDALIKIETAIGLPISVRINVR